MKGICNFTKPCLQRACEPRVVVLEGGELDLPLLGVGGALGQRQLQAIVLILQLSNKME